MDERVEVFVAVLARSQGGIHPETVGALWNLDLPENHVKSLILDQTHAQGRSEAVERAKFFDADSLLFIDADMDFRPDLYKRLNAIEADICAGFFWSRRVPSAPTIMRRVERDGELFLKSMWPTGQIEEVDGVGMAATLIRKRVLDWTTKPAFMDAGMTGEDMLFCLKAREAGFIIKSDTSLEVGHWGHVCFNGQDILSDPTNRSLTSPFGDHEINLLWTSAREMPQKVTTRPRANPE